MPNTELDDITQDAKRATRLVDQRPNMTGVNERMGRFDNAKLRELPPANTSLQQVAAERAVPKVGPIEGGGVRAAALAPPGPPPQPIPRTGPLFEAPRVNEVANEISRMVPPPENVPTPGGARADILKPAAVNSPRPSVGQLLDNASMRYEGTPRINDVARAAASRTPVAPPVPTGPIPADKPGMISQLRNLFGLGEAAPKAAPVPTPTPVPTPAANLAAEEATIKSAAYKAGKLGGKAVRAVAPVARVAGPVLAGADVVSHFNDYKINDPEVDSSLGGTFNALAKGDFKGAGSSISKGALETLMDLGSAGANMLDYVVPGKAPVSSAYDRKLYQTFGNQLTAHPSVLEQAAAATAANEAKPKPAAASVAAPEKPAPAPATVAQPTNAPAGDSIAQAAKQSTSDIEQQYQQLQQEQLDSPIAFITTGGGVSQVHYKDGSAADLLPGQEPDDVLQFNQRTQQMLGLQHQFGGAKAAPANSGSGYRAGTDMDRIIAITRQSESNNNPNAIGPYVKGQGTAKGAMQVMDATNRDPGYGVAPARDNSPEERERVGREYLAALHGNYGGDMAMTWAAYNAGPGNVDKAIKAARQNGTSWLDALAKFQTPDKHRETVNYVHKNMEQLLASDTQGAPPGTAAPTIANGDSVPEFARKQPVGVINGTQRAVDVPYVGGYAQVPRSIYDAGMVQGNVPGAVRDYQANALQAERFAANPHLAELEKQRLANKGLVEAHQATGTSNEKVARINAEATSKNIINNPEAVGVDITGTPQIKDVPYVRDTDGTIRRAVPKESANGAALPDGVTAPVLRTNSIAKVKADPKLLNEVNAILKKFGQPELSAAEIR